MKISSGFLLALTVVLASLPVRDVSAQSISLPYPDMLAGRSLNPITYRGDNVYNATGAGQRVRIKSDRQIARAYFICENDTFSVDRFKFRGKRGNRKVKMRYVLLSNGTRSNVTGQMITGNFERRLSVDSSIQFLARAKKRRRVRNRRARLPVWIQADSAEFETADRAVARLIFKRKR